MESIAKWFTAKEPRELLGVALLFLLIAWGATWPLVTAPSELSVSGRANSDVFLNQYLIFWGLHALVEDPTNLYHTNMFHPAPYTFAYADMLLTDSLLMAPVIWAFYDPTLTYNALLWVAMIIGGTGMYFLAREFVGWRTPAFVAALLFVLNATHFARYRQPQFFNDGFLPWFLAVLLMWLASCGLRPLRRRGDFSARGSLALAAIAAVLFCLHTQTGSHNAIFGLLVGGALVVGHLPRFWARPDPARPWLFGQQSPDLGRFARGALLMGVIGVLILGPLFYPYFVVNEYLEGERITENALLAGAIRPLDFFTSGSHFYQWLEASYGWPGDYLVAGPGPRRDLFPGFVLPLLALVALLPGQAMAGPNRTRWWLTAPLDLTLIAVTSIVVANAVSGWRAPGPAEFGPLLWGALAAIIATVRLVWLRDEAFAPWHTIRRAFAGHQLRFWVLVVVVGFLAALGPAAYVYDLVRLVPGANLIRVPSRFLLPAVMALCVLAAVGTQRIWRRGGWKGKALVYALVALFVVESSFAPLPTTANPYPKTELGEWLGEQPGDFAIVEYPIRALRTDGSRQIHQSIHHWKKLLVGYSGSVPPGYHERIDRIDRGFPSAEVLDELATLDVRYVILREIRISPDKRREIEDEPRLSFVREFGDETVWELDAADG